MRADPKTTKKTDSLTVFLAFLGSAHVKAARRMLVKLTPGQILFSDLFENDHRSIFF